MTLFSKNGPHSQAGLVQLISMGDCISPGEYLLHSRFTKAANFFNRADGYLATVVTPSVGNGPANLVVAGFQPKEARALIVLSAGHVHLNGLELVDTTRIFRSRLVPEQWEHNFLVAAIAHLERCLVNLASPESLVFLLYNDNDTAAGMGTPASFSAPPTLPKATFKELVKNRLRQGVDTIFSPQSGEHKQGWPGTADDVQAVIRGVEMIEGLGWGLTPCGDDFVAGMLAALTVWSPRPLVQPLLERLRQHVGTRRSNHNPLTRAFLTMAAGGYFFEKMHTLTDALAARDRSQIELATSDLLAHGETSGADMATGFLLTLKHLAQVESSQR